MARYVLDPDATLKFTKDWSRWLAEGETITAATVTVTTGATKQSESFDATSVTAKLTAGVLGSTVTITYHVTTSAGNVDDRSDTVTIRER